MNVRLASMNAAVAIACGFSAMAAAQSPPQPAPDRYLAGNCTTCHGTHGRSSGATPNLAGAERAWLVLQMKDFRDGKRPATIMHQISKGYTDEQLNALADHFARQSPAR